MLDATSVETYRTDGVVLLPGLMADWVEELRYGVEENRRAPSPWAYQYTVEGERVGFWTDYVTWQDVEPYRRAVFDSPLAAAAAALMGGATVRFFHEHVLVKEPGTHERTPWHHDQPYYCVDGDMNVSMWVALDPVPSAQGMRFLAGSHRSGRWFVPRRFADHVPYAPPDERFELVPDVDVTLDERDLRSFDVEPGDAIAFHFRTLHDAPGTEHSVVRRRAISFRWLGEDTTFALRPWLHSPPFAPQGLREGSSLDDPRFPLVPVAGREDGGPEGPPSSSRS